MENKKLNFIWKELHELGKKLPESFKLLAKSIAEQKESNDKNTEKIVDTIKAQDLDRGTPDIVSAIKDSEQKQLDSSKTTLEELQTIPTKTFKVEVTNHQEQKDIEIPDTITLNEKQFAELKKALQIDNKVTVKAPDVSVEIPEQMRVDTSQDVGDYIPTRLTDGKKFINIEALLKDIFQAAQQGASSYIPTVESTDNPGVFGVVMLNPDGSTISAGSTPTDPDTAVDNLEMQNGDDLLLQDDSFVLIQ